MERENYCSPCFFLVELGQLCVPQVVITGQDAPSTDKRLREDLYQKVKSGDQVAARLPCTLDEDGHIFGLEEVRDERDKFQGATEMTFPSTRDDLSSSTVRGSLVQSASPSEGLRCVERDGRGREEKKGAAKAQKYRSHLAWMSAVRDQVAVVETDNMALVLSQGGTCVLRKRSVTSVVGFRHHSEHSAAATWFVST